MNPTTFNSLTHLLLVPKLAATSECPNLWPQFLMAGSSLKRCTPKVEKRGRLRLWAVGGCCSQVGPPACSSFLSHFSYFFVNREAHSPVARIQHLSSLERYSIEPRRTAINYFYKRSTNAQEQQPATFSFSCIDSFGGCASVVRSTLRVH